jgi:hypothetical protein
MQEEAKRDIDSTVPSKAVEKHVLEPTERGNVVEISTRREQRIQDLFEEALAEKSPIQCILALSAGDHFVLGQTLKTLILDAMRSCRDVRDMKELSPFFESYSRLERQAERMTRLKHDIAHGGQSSKDRSPRRLQ